jgi:hypothetical protein
MYITIGNRKVEVVKNPSSNDKSAMKKEYKEREGRKRRGGKKSRQDDGPLLRYIEIDSDKYYWIAYDAIHNEIETKLKVVAQGCVDLLI